MWKLLAWISWLVIVIVGLWELEQAEPHLPRLVTGLLLVGISGLAGLRIGTDYDTAFVRDAIHTNKILMEQNHELIDLNQRYMKSQSSKTLESSEAQHTTLHKH